MADGQEIWREKRARTINAHAAAHQRDRAVETAMARQVVAQFVNEASARGLPAAPLRARAGRSTYRTRLRGWYLTRDVAVGEDGELYLLTVPASLRARIAGAELVPHQPGLIVGEGGRDGESIPLRTLVQRRLAAGAGPWYQLGGSGLGAAVPNRRSR